MALKLKLGSADTPRICLLSAVRGRELALLVWKDIGRRWEEMDADVEEVEGSLGVEAWLRIGKTNCGLETMSICGAWVAIGMVVMVSVY